MRNWITDQIDEWSDVEDVPYKKISGTLEAGRKIDIYWKENDGFQIVDNAYIFQTPECDSDLDFFIHCPNPEGDRDSSQSEWKHINDLLLNEQCERIVVLNK